MMLSMKSQTKQLLQPEILTSKTDLFRLVDQAGDGNWKISQEEFSLLATRLRIKMSEHRIKEIFAKIRGHSNENMNIEEYELDQSEFELALDYLSEKNLTQTLKLLGITPEILTAWLFTLTSILFMIFAFIFFGIRAFSMGGTFGAIINSIFPAAGGIGLARNTDNKKEVLRPEKIEKYTNKALAITQSDKL